MLKVIVMFSKKKDWKQRLIGTSYVNLVVEITEFQCVKKGDKVMEIINWKQYANH